ncbi:MAG: potassium transporter TrkH [Nitrospinae bacterium CG11_big_fil_rev_8_21_14_0_20_45_15]|nr:MAG: potassium transporter TrkH [Nitrospinae bacterium CG11_big_fil_rev_8_21_14_0_20_45_15]
MNFRQIFYIIGILLIVFGIAMFIPAIVDFKDNNADWKSFLSAGLITLACGSGMYFSYPKTEIHLNVRESFVLTSFTWFLISLFAAVPIYLSNLSVSFTDSLFEAISGLTTTGSTILVGLDQMPMGILLWRGLLQWIGGIGIIVLAISVLPFLGVGGMHLFHTESSEQSPKPMPKLKTLTRTITLVYIGLTLLCTASYHYSGMNLFEACVHAMTTLSTGGFSTSDLSMGHFENPVIHWEAVVFMILGSLPYLLYVRALQGHGEELWEDEQVRFYLAFLFISIFLLTLWLWNTRNEPFGDVLNHVAFHIVSIITTTGYTTTDYSLWGTLAFELFFFFLFIGGCSGSTSSGIKIFRFQVIFKLILVKIKRLSHPHIITIPKFNKNTISDEARESIATFFAFYVLFTGVIAILLSLMGLDFITSVSASITAIANVGPGLGDIIGPAGNFKPLSDPAKWILSFAMLVGRLELFTILILFFPMFWKK